MRRSGFSLLYAALDQGNRLDWLNSGLINALLLGGILLLAAFVVQEFVRRDPGSIFAGPRKATYRCCFFWSPSSVSPSSPHPTSSRSILGNVQDYRAIEIGGVLLWIALPQFLIAPVTATILRYVEPRITLALGFALVGIGCFMAGQLTDDWVGVDFLPSQLVQAMGQSIGLTSLVWFFLRHLEPSEVLTFGAVLQTGRLFGAQLGAAFIQTFVRTREQVYSNLVGLHVTTGSVETSQRLQEYAQAVAARSVGPAAANARATGLLAHSVQVQAYVLAYIDGFMVIGFAAIGVLLMMLTLRNPPHPAIGSTR